MVYSYLSMESERSAPVAVDAKTQRSVGIQKEGLPVSDTNYRDSAILKMLLRCLQSGGATSIVALRSWMEMTS
jgi:hypothetical protein